MHGVYGGIVIVREVGSRKKERETGARGFILVERIETEWIGGTA